MKRNSMNTPPGRGVEFGYDHMLSIGETANRAGMGTRTMWRLISTGRFANPDFRLGKRIVRWRASTVESWIEAQRPPGN